MNPFMREIRIGRSQLTKATNKIIHNIVDDFAAIIYVENNEYVIEMLIGYKSDMIKILRAQNIIVY
jgi:hypothetical protein